MTIRITRPRNSNLRTGQIGEILYSLSSGEKAVEFKDTPNFLGEKADRIIACLPSEYEPVCPTTAK